MSAIQLSPMKSLLAQLKVKKSIKNHTGNRRDRDEDCSGTGLLKRPDEGRSRPIPEPVKSVDNELSTLVEQIIKISVPIMKNGILTGIKDGAQAIVDTLEHMLDSTYLEVSDTFKINSTQVLFIILDNESLDKKIKSKAFDLLIKLAKDTKFEVVAAACEKLLDIHKKHGCPADYVQPLSLCLLEAKKFLHLSNKYPALLQRIDYVFDHSY